MRQKEVGEFSSNFLLLCAARRGRYGNKTAIKASKPPDRLRRKEGFDIILHVH